MPLNEWTDKERNYHVNDATVPVVTLFTMPTCRPCKAFEALLEGLAEEFGTQVLFGKMRADEYSGECQIDAVPFVHVTNLGRVFETFGIRDIHKIRDTIEAAQEDIELLQHGKEN